MARVRSECTSATVLLLGYGTNMDASQFVNITRTTTPQQVARGLEQMILTGGVLPGERVNESVLARSIGISRNTVREALRLQESTGLLRKHPSGGMAVWDPAREEVQDLFTARFHLETLAASHIDETTDLTGVQHAFEDLQSVLDLRDPNVIVEKDLQVHIATVELLSNAYLTETFNSLMMRMRFFAFILSIEGHEYDDIDALENEHKVIVEALETRDPKHAVDVVGSAVLKVSDDVRSVLHRRRQRQ